MSQLLVNPKLPPFPTRLDTEKPKTTDQTVKASPSRSTRDVAATFDLKPTSETKILTLENGKTYRMSGWTLPSGSIVNGNGAIIMCSANPAFILQNATDVRISDCFFVGSAFSESDASAINATNSSLLLRSCTFRNLNCAVKLVDCFQKNVQAPIVETCSFEHCGFGVFQTGDQSFSLIRDNCFENCHVGAYMAGGNYDVSGNVFEDCHCSLFRVKPSYSFTGPCIGAFIGNTCKFQKSSWPNVLNHNSKDVNLHAVVYDDEEHAPPLICSNTFVNCCPHIANCKSDIDYAIVGCSLLNDPPAVIGEACKESVSLCGWTVAKSNKRKREEESNEIPEL